MTCRLIISQLKPAVRTHFYYAQYRHLQFDKGGRRNIGRWARNDKRYLLLKLFEGFIDPLISALSENGWRKLFRAKQIVHINIKRQPKVKLLRLIKEEEFSMVVSIGPMIISKGLLQSDVRFFNVHSAKLPEFGGLANEVWVRLFDETRMYSTIHTMSPKLDSGVVLASRSEEISPDWSIFRTNIENCKLSGKLLHYFIENSNAIPGKESAPAIESTCRSMPSKQHVDEIRRKNIALIRKEDFKCLYA
jgi:hypothetical protein